MHCCILVEVCDEVGVGWEGVEKFVVIVFPLVVALRVGVPGCITPPPDSGPNEELVLDCGMAACVRSVVEFVSGFGGFGARREERWLPGKRHFDRGCEV